MNVNHVVVAGRVVHTPDVSGTKSGKIKVRLSLATNKYWYSEAREKKEKVTFHNIIAYGSTASLIEKFVEKGQVVLVIGELDNYSYEGKDGTTKYRSEIIARTIQLGQRAKSKDSDPVADGEENQDHGLPSEGEESQLPEITDAEAEEAFNELMSEDIPF